MDVRYIELNPAYEIQTGVVIKNALGKTTKELKYNIEAYWFEAYGEVALTGESMRFVNEVKTWNKWFDVYVFRIDSENKIIGVLSNDITESVLHNKKLEELIKMQDELYVNVSHELKTPLNVIFSANQMMDIYINSSMGDKKEKLINYNNNIKQNCYRITKLINNIVDLSKCNSGLLTLNRVNVNIVDFIKKIVQSVSQFVESKNMKIAFNANTEKIIVACDPDKIERVVLNLISNAIKFSKPNSEIYVGVDNKGDTVEISVVDTGAGIEKQNLKKIFNKFYQEDKSLSRNAEGSGIGLPLVKSLVELHGGKVMVESEVNKGSTFIVQLPSFTTIIQDSEEQVYSFNNKIEAIKIEFSDIYSI